MPAGFPEPIMHLLQLKPRWSICSARKGSKNQISPGKNFWSMRGNGKKNTVALFSISLKSWAPPVTGIERHSPWMKPGLKRSSMCLLIYTERENSTGGKGWSIGILLHKLYFPMKKYCTKKKAPPFTKSNISYKGHKMNGSPLLQPGQKPSWVIPPLLYTLTMKDIFTFRANRPLFL